MATVANVTNVANVAAASRNCVDFDNDGGSGFDGAAFWSRLAAASAGAGVIELGAGETGLVGLMAAKLLKCHCSSGNTAKGSEWWQLSNFPLWTKGEQADVQETSRAYCDSGNFGQFCLFLLRLSY